MTPYHVLWSGLGDKNSTTNCLPQVEGLLGDVGKQTVKDSSWVSVRIKLSTSYKAALRRSILLSLKGACGRSQSQSWDSKVNRCQVVTGGLE